MAADYGGGPGVPGSGAAGIATDPLSEATVAMQQLGYKPAEAQRMARQAFAEGDVAEAIIRQALQSALRCTGPAPLRRPDRDPMALSPRPSKPQHARNADRSEERRVGEERVSTGRSRW